MVCTSSPASGTTTTTVISAKPAISTSLCPTPTVSTIIRSKFAAFISSVISMILGCNPPNEPLVANERMNTFGSSYHLLILIRSPSREPRLNGEDGSTQSTPIFFPLLTSNPMSESTKVLLPAPGGPVIPIIGLFGLGGNDRNNPS